MSACWMWGGSYYANGYGQGYSLKLKRNTQAHRLVWEALVGTIPSGMQLDHVCRVRGCVNPKHLRVVTCKENIYAPRSTCLGKLNGEKIFCPMGHAYDLQNTYTTPNGKRQCRICKLARKRASARRAIPTYIAASTTGPEVLQ